MENFPKTYKTLSGKKEQVLIDKHLDLIKAVLRNKLDIGKVINDKKQARINDDRPYNEYFFLRKTF